jgi:hypothetical protein
LRILPPQNTTRALNIWAASYTAFVYLSRPYSNQAESVVFALLFVLCTTSRLGVARAWAIGVLTGKANDGMQSFRWELAI